MKCLICESHIFKDFRVISKKKELEFFFIEEYKDSFHKVLEKNQFDVIFTKIGQNLNAEILLTQKNLKYIVSPTTGTDHIDLKYCLEKKIKVISLKGEYKFLDTISTTAEHAWTLFLNLNRDFLKSISNVKNKLWERNSLIQYQIKGDNVGIVGFGRLGKMIANYAEAFGLNIFYYDIKKLNLPKKYKKTTSLAELISKVDHLFILVNYNSGDEELINKNQIESIKLKTLINVSRGELVNEKFICDEIIKGNLKKYGTDVLRGDSSVDPKHSKIFLESSDIYKLSKTNDNILITPHCGGYAINVLKETRKFVFEKFLKDINTK